MKKPVAYIGKTLSATVVTVAAVAFISGGLLCCCLTKTAHASAVQKGCCAKKEASKTAPSKACDHCKIRSASDLGKVMDFLPSLVKPFHHVATAVTLAYVPDVRSDHPVYTGPPRQHSSLPVYLQNSCLRL